MAGAERDRVLGRDVDEEPAQHRPGAGRRDDAQLTSPSGEGAAVADAADGRELVVQRRGERELVRAEHRRGERDEDDRDERHDELVRQQAAEDRAGHRRADTEPRASRSAMPSTNIADSAAPCARDLGLLTAAEDAHRDADHRPDARSWRWSRAHQRKRWRSPAAFRRSRGPRSADRRATDLLPFIGQRRSRAGSSRVRTRGAARACVCGSCSPTSVATVGPTHRPPWRTFASLSRTAVFEPFCEIKTASCVAPVLGAGAGRMDRRILNARRVRPSSRASPSPFESRARGRCSSPQARRLGAAHEDPRYLRAGPHSPAAYARCPRTNRPYPVRTARARSSG